MTCTASMLQHCPVVDNLEPAKYNTLCVVLRRDISSRSSINSEANSGANYSELKKH